MTTQTPTLRAGDYDCNVHKGGESFFRVKEDLYSHVSIAKLERELSELEAKRKADVRWCEFIARNSIGANEIRAEFPDCFTGDGNESR